VVPDFDTLYDDYADFVWRNARRLGVAPAALDDVMQEVFCVAHRRLADVTQPESLRAWMFGIVIRVVRDHRRTLRRKDPAKRLGGNSVDPDLLADDREHGPHACAERADAVRLLHELLSELDDAKREVFVLAELEEMTEPEIAEVLGENANTVHSRLRAARKAFESAAQRQRSRDAWRLR
jgi:RNA polymerase sigma-70 factor (ECF subfamily)